MIAESNNQTLLRALLCKPVDYTPVWVMRQAGRYLPEYRKTRARAGGIMDLFTNPQLACEVTLQPLERFELDAAILFSDILTIPDAMGLGLYFADGEGPKFRKTIATQADVAALPIIDPQTDLPYVIDAVKLIRRELNNRVPLIGFSGSPWTLATYMIEGGSSKDFAKAKTLAFSAPELMHELLTKLSLSVQAYLNAQIAAGAQVVQIFDTWGGILSTSAYQEFSLSYMQKIIEGLATEHNGQRVPVILFTKNGGGWLQYIMQTDCDCIGLDWTIDLGTARAQTHATVALQGNMDPAILRSTPKRIEQEVKAILANFGRGSGHVFNLGHGVTPDIDPDNVRAFVDAVHEHSVVYH